MSGCVKITCKIIVNVRNGAYVNFWVNVE